MERLTESLSRCGRARQAPTYRAMCYLLRLGRWLLTTKSQTNTTGVHLHSTLEFTIMEMTSIRHFSLPAPGSLCIFISPILHPAICISRREDSLNYNRVKNNLGVSRNCNFGHRMKPSRLFSEASRDSRSTAKSNGSIIPFTTQRFVVSYRILCFELETDGQPHSPCFCLVSFIQSHLPFPCTTYA